ncbi:MAG: TMEM175 family protein [Acidimicrobiales bacterium]
MLFSQRRTSADTPAQGGPERLTGFSDGVMAVIITIMAFELRPPDGASFAAMAHQLPRLLIYMLSFAMIGIYWNNHHHLLRATDRIDGAVMWANLHLLFWLSLMPVLTEWVGEDYRFHLPAAVYGMAALGAALAYWVLVRMIVAANGDDSAVAKAIGSDFKGMVSEVLYAAGIGLAFWTPWAAYVLYCTVAVIWFAPDRRFAQQPGKCPP